MNMTTLHISWTKLWTIGCLAMTLAACSDGQLSQPPPSLSESTSAPLLIKSFKVADLNAPKAEAGDSTADEKKPVSIESGGTVMVSWEVIGASKVEITDSKGKHLTNASGLAGATPSDPLMADETFTLTAEGSDGVKAQSTASVTVRKKEAKIASFTAENPAIKAGESTQLCWSISDPSLKVSVTDGKDVIYPSNNDEVPVTQTDDPPVDVTVTTTSKAMMFLLKGADIPSAPPVDSYAVVTPEPAKEQDVCPVTVKPDKTTTYTLTIMDGDTVAAEQTMTVTVESAPAVIAAFVAQPAQLTGPGEVTLTWRVTPSDVTVSIDHGVTTNDKSDGEKTVRVTDTTTFTLTATTKDGQSTTQTVTVTLPSAADRKVVAKTLTPSIFAGETAKIAIMHGNVLGTVSVLDGLGRAPAFTMDGTVLSIKDAPVGSSSYIIDIDGERSNPVTVEVRALSQNDRGAWNGVAMQGLGMVVAGSSSKTAQLGLASLLDFSRFTPVSYDFGKAFAEKMKTPDHAAYLSKFAPYTVNSVVISSKGRAIAGVTGGLLYSDNSGMSWNVLDVIPAYDTSYKYKDAEESHTGCFGVKRVGTKSYSASIWMVNVFEVCDLVYDEAAAGKDRLLIATDFGVFYIDGVDGRIKDPANKANAMQGTLKKDNALFGKAVNSIAIAKAGDATVVVAGAVDGIYINAKRGDYKSWQKIDAAGMKSAVNTVAISGSTIYAGTDKGLFKSNGLDASSTFTQVTISTDPVAVKALAVDAADSATIYVGTAKSLKISRDCAGSFADVAVDVGEVRNIATSADSGRSAIVLTSKNGLFTSVGVAGEAGTCAASTPAPQPTTGGTTTGSSQPSSLTSGPGTAVPQS